MLEEINNKHLKKILPNFNGEMIEELIMNFINEFKYSLFIIPVTFENDDSFNFVTFNVEEGIFFHCLLV